MADRIPTYQRPGQDEAKKAARREADKRRGTRTQRGYSNRWLRAAALFRQENPLCAQCMREGIVRSADVVDHIIPHKGDVELFWDSATNWESLCKRHHDLKTANHDGGFGRAVRGQRNVICGAPGSGKSTYVMMRARTGDFVWDFDEVASGLFGTPLYDRPVEGIPIVQAMLEAACKALEARPFTAGVWIICTSPTLAKNVAQRIKGSVTTLDTPAPECKARIERDGRGERHADILASVDKWFDLAEATK